MSKVITDQENAMIVGAQDEDFRNSMNGSNYHELYDEDMTWWYYKQKGAI